MKDEMEKQKQQMEQQMEQQKQALQEEIHRLKNNSIETHSATASAVLNKSNTATLAPSNEATQHHKRVSTQLPSNWKKHIDANGKQFYSDGSRSTWDPPEGSTGGRTGTPPVTTSEPTTTTTDPDVEIHQDDRGRRYSYNAGTGESKWMEDESE